MPPLEMSNRRQGRQGSWRPEPRSRPHPRVFPQVLEAVACGPSQPLPLLPPGAHGVQGHDRLTWSRNCWTGRTAQP